MRLKYRALGILVLVVLAFALVPALAMGAPAITQGVQGVVKDATTGAPIPFAWVEIWVGAAPSVEMMTDYDGTYSLSTVVSDDIDIHAGASYRHSDSAYPVTVETGKVTTVDFSLARVPNFKQPVYRFFNMKGGVHFYTASDAEFMGVYKSMSSVFKYDGIGYWIPQGPDVPPTVNESGYINRSTTPLYRFFNKKTGVHFYTMDEAEMNNVKNNLASRFTYEGIAYNVSSSAAWGVPIYRFYNPGRNAHFYTADQSEIFDKLSNYFHFEGIGFYTGDWEWVQPLPDGGEQPF